MGALDTDYNGANTGLIVGTAAEIQGKLASALSSDAIKPQVFGFHNNEKVLAERTAVHKKAEKSFADRKN